MFVINIKLKIYSYETINAYFTSFFATHIFAQIYVPNGINGILNSTTGKIGIGKNNPTSLFDVYGVTNPSAMVSGPNGTLELGIATGNGAYAPYARTGNVILRVLGGINEEKGMLFNITNDLADGRSYFKFGDNKNGGWFSIYNNKKVSIDGLVGIGTSNPTMALEVNGKIRAKEIIVESGWADFVFSNDYTLPTLAEVESHIKEHGHLPDMPSEADVKENGIGLSEMNTKLLQKIEELTLYIIHSDKELKQLKKELDSLKKK